MAGAFLMVAHAFVWFWFASL